MPTKAEYRALVSAARAVLSAWDADDDLEQQDLSDQFWAAMRELRRALEYV